MTSIRHARMLESGKAGICYRYWKLEFTTQGISSRVELLQTQKSAKNTQDPFEIVCRCENMAVQAIELSKGDITQGVHYPKDSLEVLHMPMLCRVHIFHHSDKLSRCPLHESLDGLLRWPCRGDVGAKWMGLPDLLEFRPQKTPYFGVGHIRSVENNCIDHLAQVVRVERVPVKSVIFAMG